MKSMNVLQRMKSSFRCSKDTVVFEEALKFSERDFVVGLLDMQATGSSGIRFAIQRIKIPYPFQWGTSIFSAGSVFMMMGAPLVSAAEVETRRQVHDQHGHHAEEKVRTRKHKVHEETEQQSPTKKTKQDKEDEHRKTITKTTASNKEYDEFFLVFLGRQFWEYVWFVISVKICQNWIAECKLTHIQYVTCNESF